MSRRPVSALSRAIDAASLLLVVGGSMLYYRAFNGMRALKDRAAADPGFIPGQTEAFGYVEEFSRLRLTSWVALGLAIAGVGVGVYAARHARKQHAALETEE